jgi:hypothetical protein
MRGLCLVAAGRKRVERASAQQAHAVLGVTNFAARGELEGAARRLVGEPPLDRHLREVAETVTDHELRVARGRDERGNRFGGMLAVGVDDEHGVGAAGVVDAGAHGRSLPRPLG